MSQIEVIDCLGDWRWRLANLYWIVDEQGKKVKFQPNPEQLDLLNEMHFYNLVLKARQLGFTTLIDILALDQVFFTKDYTAAIIAHGLNEAGKIFRNKVQYPWKNLPDAVKALNPPTNVSASEMVFSNGSSISVATSARSGTLQFLHISEYGKICRRYPEKASEIKLGALPAVHAGGLVFVESTAEGCYDDQTDILTDAGWVSFKELGGMLDCKILSMSAETKVAYYESDWRYIAKHWDGDMVRFSSRTVDLLVTPDHNMWSARQKGPYRMQRADSMLGTTTDFRFERGMKWVSAGCDEFKLPEYCHNQGSGRRTHCEKIVPIELWLKFLGYFLADGHVTWADGCKQVALTQAKYVDDFRVVSQSVADILGCKLGDRPHNVGKPGSGEARRFTIASAQLANYLRGFTKPKRIPRDLLMSMSNQQCRTLLDAIYLGDGCQEHRNRDTGVDYGRIFAGVDKEFQDDIQELALKAGYATSAYGPERNRVATFTESTTSMLRHSNPPIKEAYRGDVYCVAIPQDHLLMVRRNGTAMWCGNTGGHFYEMVDEAQKRIAEPSDMEFKLHFYPWWKKESYRLNPDGVKIENEIIDYFNELETNHGIFVDDAQVAWYAVKRRMFKDDMKQEYPSTPEEAFSGAMEERYFGEQMAAVRKQGRIRNIPIISNAGVNLYWDLGRDTTAIWFHQYAALEHRMIDYLQDSGKTLDFYAREIQKRGYLLKNIYLPHDAGDQSVVTSKTAESEIKRLFPGIKVRVVPRIQQKYLAVDMARSRLSECYFHEANCAKGIECLDNYRKKWNESIGNWSDEPVHDQYSHGADAFMQFAQGWEPSHDHGVAKQPVIQEWAPLDETTGY